MKKTMLLSLLILLKLDRIRILYRIFLNMSTKNKKLFSPEKIVDNLLDFEEKLRAGTAKGMSYEYLNHVSNKNTHGLPSRDSR